MKSTWRSLGGIVDQAGNAAWAASMARRVSSPSPDATSARTSRVHGS